MDDLLVTGRAGEQGLELYPSGATWRTPSRWRSPRPSAPVAATSRPGATEFVVTLPCRTEPLGPGPPEQRGTDLAAADRRTRE
ncbi:MAG: hypothetical protein M3211_03070 [Actinomycetota bacterium]|nr:hypothetical protein [Actinomycetota bacterium]